MRDYTLKYWILAARPKTLPASIMPVLVGCSLAYKEERFVWIPALICFVFALLAQVVSNFFNDYFDYLKGTDRKDRLGPERAVANGWIKPKTMLIASLILIAFACLLGCILIYYAGWGMIGVGLAVALGAFAYSAGPYPLSYNGWGDICVVVFYGIIPVGFTYYVQALDWNLATTLSGLAMGIVATNILVANNYRDREADEISGKRTTIVRFGQSFGLIFYLSNGILAVATCLFFLLTDYHFAALFPFLYIPFHLRTWKEMSRINQGKELNKILAQSSRNTIILGVLIALGILLS